MFGFFAMNDHERDDLWDLLGRVRPAKASSFFARNVLRAIREEKSIPSGIVDWLMSRWALIGSVAAVLAFAGIVASKPEEKPTQVSEVAVSVDSLAQHVTESPDYAVIGNLDELLAAQESSAWLSSYTVD